MHNNRQKRFKFPIWGWFFVFFAVVFTMDGIMVTFATKTFDGVSVEDAYNKGLQHNKTLNKAAELKGWQSEINWENETKTVTASFINAEDVPLENGRVSVTFFRPTHEGYDFSLDLFEQPAGVYKTMEKIEFPLQGLWEIRLKAEKNGQVLQSKKRIMVRP